MLKKIFVASLVFTLNSFANVISVNDSNFNSEVLSSKKPVIVKTFTPWCGACQDMAPAFRKASNELSKYKFVELNTIQNPGMRNRYKIKYVPTTLIFVNGKVVFRHVGSLSSSQIKSLADQYVK